MMKKVSFALLCGTSLCLLTAALNAQTTTILSENWANGSRSTQSLPNSAQWFTSGPGSTLTATQGSMTITPSGTSRYALAYFAPQGTPQTIQQGQVMTLSYDFSFTGIPETDGSWLRVGLFNSNTSTSATKRVGGDNAGQNAGAYAGYTGYMIDETNIRAGADSRIWKRRTDATSNNLMTSTGSIYTRLDEGTTFYGGYTNDTTYNGVLLIAHNLDGTVTLTHNVYYFDQNQNKQLLFSMSAIDSSGVYTQFDTVAFTPASTSSTSMTLYDVNITLGQIPEPSSVAAVGAGIALLLCLGLRRRARKHTVA